MTPYLKNGYLQYREYLDREDLPFVSISNNSPSDLFYKLLYSREKYAKVKNNEMVCPICKESFAIAYGFKKWEWSSLVLHYANKHSTLPSEQFLRFLKNAEYKPEIKYGFTGSRKTCDEKLIQRTLDLIELRKRDIIITGACVGIDSQIAQYVKKRYPFIKQCVIVPANKTQIDVKAIKCGDLVYHMPSGTDYRDRNQVLVNVSHKIIAFWDGNTISGTKMTINIAQKQNKLFFTTKI